MRARILAILAYIGAAVTLLIAACVPFVLMGVFSNAVAHAGLHMDPSYSGGTIVRTVAHGRYQTDVYAPVRPRALQQVHAFVQVAFRPVSALPRHVSEEIDLDGDGQPDVRVSFTVPTGPHARPIGEVVALNAKYQSFTMPGNYSFSEMMVQSGGAVVVRVPLR